MDPKARKEKEESIRSHSEAYGHRWCADHAPKLVAAIAACKAGETAPSPIVVRAYDRVSNAMSEVPLETVIKSLVLDAEGVPIRLRPTPFGQVAITPKMLVSSAIYHLITAVYVVVPT